MSTDNQQKNLPTTQKPGSGINIISSITLPTGNVQPKSISPEINHDNNGKSYSKLRRKLAPLKGRPWSWYTSAQSNLGSNFTSTNNSVELGSQEIRTHDKSIGIMRTTQIITSNYQLAIFTVAAPLTETVLRRNTDASTASIKNILPGWPGTNEEDFVITGKHEAAHLMQISRPNFLISL